jgi:hypothetical protein
LRKEGTVSAERVAGWIVIAILLVLFILFMLAVIDRIDADAAESIVRGVDVALGRGWDRIGGRVS